VAQRVTSSRFVGREAEFAELVRALAGTVPEDLPALYFVAGESGVGKTRLLRQLIGKAEGDGVRVLGGTCIELGEDELPYAPLVAALRPLHRTCEPILDELSPGTRAELARLNPEIGEPSADAESERGEAQRRLFDAFLELVSRLGEEGPVVLWIEDIHWADRSTRSFLRFLAASVAEERVLVVATYRADELHRRHPLRPLLAELERTPRARRIELERFDRAELADQLADILGEVPVGDVVERLYGRSNGNPLFTEELVAAARFRRAFARRSCCASSAFPR
jgi:predicted ATPase